MNVQNDYGDTDFSVAAEPADGAHRIVSHSGLVRVVLIPGVKPAIPLFLATNCGTLRTTFGRKELEDLDVYRRSEHDSKRRGWRVFHSPVGNDLLARFRLHGRADEAIFDKERSAGLDFISRTGRVELLRRETADTAEQ